MTTGRNFLAVMAIMALISLPGFAKNGETYTGEVSDSMCGAEHMMQGSKAKCTRACVGKGSNYSLVVHDKVYTLETNDKAALAKLNQLAGSNARITGKMNGDSIVVTGVSATK